MEALKLMGSGLVGALAGGAAVSLSGMKAVGMMGGGTGFGTTAQIAGRTFGAIAGLASYGVYRAAEAEYKRAQQRREEREEEQR